MPWLLGLSVALFACRHTPEAGSQPSASGAGTRAEPNGAPASSAQPVASTAAVASAATPPALANGVRSQADCPEGMIFIPAADPTFTMPVVGSEDRTPKPQRFHVDAFCIDRTEVPASKWSDSLCGAPQPGCLYDASGSGPAVCVDHRQAECYCERATPGVPKRLPTDPEFLLAALGTDGRAHPWGDPALPSGANIGRNFCPQQRGPAKDWICSVKKNLLDSSPYGVIGLDSNGEEMTGSCFTTPQGPACVCRAGSDGTSPGLLLAHLVIESNGAAGAMPALGFRCAVSERGR
jgi:formylglycine-generating enzyme required for sulfatase activity